MQVETILVSVQVLQVLLSSVLPHWPGEGIQYGKPYFSLTQGKCK